MLHGRRHHASLLFLTLCGGWGKPLCAQQPATYTWQQLREKFEQSNPTLKAEKLNIDESREAEFTERHLRSLDDSLHLSALGISLPLGEIYRDTGLR